MKKLIVLSISLINLAHAGFYFSGGLGMTHNNDKLYSSSSNYINGGEAQYTGSLNMGYQPVSNTATGGGYFFDFGLGIETGDNLMQSSNNAEVKKDFQLLMRVGSMFQASQRTFPYVFVAGLYNMDVDLESSNLSTKTTKDIFGMGGGVGIRAFAGQNGFYDFSYLYYTADEESLGTYSDSSNANYTLSNGVFTAAIGYMF
ncbi:MAG: hypothetical protein VX835_01780 [Pseudomonadota bacterium]|nr:hypothetical protein [Pseudomonadota bacterium]